MIPQLAPFNFHTTIQLRWRDIDQFGHVNNAVYLTYFETSRFYYNRDVNNWDWNQDQYIIASVKVDYLRPIFYPGDIKVYLRTTNVGEKSFEFHYAITFERNGIEKLAATGQTTQVFYDLKNQKTIPIPERIVKQWQAFEKEDYFASKNN
ncbi:MAG: acyl-CoA thioesterase [Chitinophagales bacterium]|jgi:acyl-CoA thioester hydrolase|nr:acyl-CoA thioesterase [Sphingobacteriales bacterium]